MSDYDNNSDHSDSENSQSSQSSSTETLVDAEEQNRRLREQVQALTAALKKKRKTLTKRQIVVKVRRLPKSLLAFL
jgi:hypothetical protein